MAENRVLYTQLGAGLCIRQHLSKALKEVRTQPRRSFLGGRASKTSAPPTEHMSPDTKNQSDWSPLTTALTPPQHTAGI